MNDMQEICRRIRVAIEDSGLGKGEVAKRVGVTRGTITAWIQGANTPRAHNLAALCELLDLGADELLGLRPRLPQGVNYIDAELVRQLLEATSEREVEALLQWTVSPATVGHLIPVGAKLASFSDIESAAAKISKHLESVAPRTMRRWSRMRRTDS